MSTLGIENIEHTNGTSAITVDTSGSATGSSVAPFRDYITVPTSPLTAITNTKLLTAQHSNQIIDASGNCTIISHNNCVATRINPF